MTQLLDDLKAVREWLSNEAHWTRHAYGRDADGNPTNVDDTVASTCLVGACYKVLGTSERLLSDFGPMTKALQSCIPSIDGGAIITHYNDNHSYQEVLAVVDCAIDKEVARQ